MLTVLLGPDKFATFLDVFLQMSSLLLAELFLSTLLMGSSLSSGSSVDVFS